MLNGSTHCIAPVLVSYDAKIDVFIMNTGAKLVLGPKSKERGLIPR